MSSQTLLSFLDAPVVIGDPDGRVAYVNPAFEERFQVEAAGATGNPLAALLEGGVREAVLRSVAEACEKGSSSRFRVRHGGVGYAGLTSPIVAEDARVGFVVLLLANAAEDERIHALQRQMHEPLDELGRVLDELGGQTGSEQIRALAGDAMRALARVRKWGDEFGGVLSGKPGSGGGAFDVGSLLEAVAGRVADEFAERGVDFQVHAPSRLPKVAGDPQPLQDALVALLQLRLAGCGATSSVALRARGMERDGNRSVVLAVTDAHGPDGGGGADELPSSVHEVVQQMGGELRTSVDDAAGRTTALRLDAPKQ